jgi:tetratricopeptide (TPR) repeat protein
LRLIKIKIILILLAVAVAVPGISRAQEGFETAELLFTRAVLAYDEGKYAEAIGDLLKAHEVDPAHIDVIYYLGLSYNAEGNFTQAERYVRQGLEIQPKNSDLRYGLGIALYGQNRFDDALKEFLPIYEREPQKDNLGYYIGLCYYQKKDYGTAANYFRKNFSAEVKTRQLNQYYLGLALQGMGREAEAIEELTEAVKIAPAAPIVGATQQLLTALRESTGAKRLSLELTLNAQYDTNPTGARVAKKSYGNLLNARADYTLYKSGPWEATINYSLLQTLNYEAHKDDINDHLVGANFYYKASLAGMPTTAGLQLNNDILLLGGTKYLQRPTGTLTYTVQENSSNFTTTLLRPQYKDFFQRGVSEKRDATNTLAGFLHYITFAGGQYQVDFGYNFDNEHALSTDWSYNGYKAVAGLTVNLPWELRGTANVDYHARFYGAQTILGGHRRDDETTALAAVSKNITPLLAALSTALAKDSTVTATLQHLWDRNSSTIPTFRTVREVVAFGLTWRY